MKREILRFLFILLTFLFGFSAVIAINDIQFVAPTPDGNVSGNSVYINLSVDSDREYYSFVDFDNDLIGWWRMDDNNGAIVYDNSSYGNNGYLMNGMGIGSGKYGNSSVGDGVDNFIRIIDSSDFDAIANNNELTACVWIKPYSTSNTLGSHMGVLGQWWSNGIYSYTEKSFAIAEGITAVNGGYSFYVSPDGNSWVDAKSNGALSLNEWHHLCGTFDGSTSRFYVDGVQQSDTGSASSIYNADAPLTIGTYFYSSSSSANSTLYYDGELDDVLIYSRALSLNEIRSIYNSSQYGSFENNYTNLVNGSHSFTGYAVESDGGLDSVSKTLFTGIVGQDSGNETNQTEGNETNGSISLPEITLTCSTTQTNNLNLTISTSESADACWFDDGSGNENMAAVNSTNFFYDDLSYGEFDISIYCNNSNGTSNLNESFVFEKYVSYYDSHFTNTQGLEIYFDFNYDYAADGGILLINSDTWSSDKDSSTLHDAENKYVPKGYAVASIETRGKGSSDGSPDAYGYDCVDIYDLAQYLLSNNNYSQYINSSKGVYIIGASGAGGRAGVCTAKYPDFFVAGHTSVGVLNLTLWHETAGSGDVAEIENRVGCTPSQCIEAYLARDAGYLSYNTQTPMSVEHPADDTRVTVGCSRDYNESLNFFGKIVNYTEPSSGGHRGNWEQSYGWFEKYSSKHFIPISGDLRIGGFVHTKNFSIYLDESSVNHIAYVDYDLSGNDKIFNLSVLSFAGDVNFKVFDLDSNVNYSVNDDCYSSDVNGDLEFSINVVSNSLTLINVSAITICEVGNETNGTSGQDNLSLNINFVNPTTIEDTSGDSLYVNLSTNSDGDHYSFVDFDGDLIGWWRIDDNNGTDVYDNSSYSNNGIFMGGAGTTSGKYGVSLEGDGNDNYISIADSSAFDAIADNDELTVCAWTYRKGNSNNFKDYQGVVGQYWAGGIHGYNRKSFAIAEDITAVDGGYGFYVSSDGSSWEDVTTNSVVPLNEWHHLCGVVESDGTVKLYVDGVQQSDTDSITGIYNPPTTPFTIGTYLYSSDNTKDTDINFNGNVDEVLLYSRGLSQSEVRAIYNSSQYASFENNYTGLIDGNYTFTGYAVDANVNSTSLTVETGVEGTIIDNPTEMTLNIPTYIIDFNVSVSDADGINNVSLWGNWTGQWVIDQVDNSGANNFTYILSKNFAPYGEGSYMWGISVEDVNGVKTYSENMTFVVDF
mgnify:CR=1 FL=1